MLSVLHSLQIDLNIYLDTAILKSMKQFIHTSIAPSPQLARRHFKVYSPSPNCTSLALNTFNYTKNKICVKHKIVASHLTN